MAYWLRLKIEYKDINGVLTTINVKQNAYAGAAETRYANAGFKFEAGDQGVDGLPQVYGSSVTVYFDAEADFEFLYLFSDDGKKHLVEIEKAGVLLWAGYIEPSTWSEPLIAPPYPVQFTAYDGLGFLQDVPYVPDGRKSVETIFTEIIANTGLDLPINFDINWAEFVTGVSSYPDHTIDTEIFEELSCYEVLEELFKTCMIYQRGGEWWVSSYSSLSTSPATVTDYWMEGEPQMDMIPAVKQLVVKQDFGYQENLVVDGSFELYNVELAKFETWDNISITPEQRTLNDDGEKYVLVAGKQYPGSYGSQGYGNITHGIKKQLAVHETTSILNISMKYGLMGDAKYAGLLFIGIRLVGSTHTYYLRRKPYVLKDQEWEWVDLALKPSLGDAHISLGSHLLKTSGTGPAPGLYYNTFDPVPAWPYNQIIDHFETFKASVAGIPADGLLEIYLYVPYSDRSQIAGSCFTGVTLELLDEDSEQYPAEKTYTIENDLNNNMSPDDYEMIVGDYPDVKNNLIIYKGGFRRPGDVDPTTAWGIDGSATVYTFAEFIGRMAVAAERSPRQIYEARLADVIPNVIVIFEDPNNPGKKFIEAGMSYDDRYQSVEGSFAELIEMDIAAATVEDSTAYSIPDKPALISVTANPTNIEERVTLKDKGGVNISAPGYLYSNDFEEKLREPDDPENDGFTRFQIKNFGVSPYALDFDSGTPQFSLAGAAVEVNFGGDENTIKVYAGQLISHNFYALDRDDKQKVLDT